MASAKQAPAVRETAAELQRTRRDPRAVEPLIAILENSKEDERLRTAAEQLDLDRDGKVLIHRHTLR